MIYGYLQTPSPAARCFPSGEKVRHEIVRELRFRKNLVCFLKVGEYSTTVAPAVKASCPSVGEKATPLLVEAVIPITLSSVSFTTDFF